MYIQCRLLFWLVYRYTYMLRHLVIFCIVLRASSVVMWTYLSSCKFNTFVTMTVIMFMCNSYHSITVYVLLYGEYYIDL